MGTLEGLSVYELIDRYGTLGEDVKRLTEQQEETKHAIEAKLKEMNSAPGTILEAERYKATWDQKRVKTIDLRRMLAVAGEAFWDLIKPRVVEIEKQLRPDQIGQILTIQKSEQCALTIGPKKRGAALPH